MTQQTPSKTGSFFDIIAKSGKSDTEKLKVLLQKESVEFLKKFLDSNMDVVKEHTSSNVWPSPLNPISSPMWLAVAAQLGEASQNVRDPQMSKLLDRLALSALIVNRISELN